jgi:acyl-CoA hydrolase
MAGYALAAPIDNGRLSYVPVRLSAVANLLAGPLRPSVAVVAGQPSGRGFRFARSAGWGPAAARAADQVVVEVHAGDPSLDAPMIEGDIRAVVERDHVPAPPPRPSLTDADRRIGELVAELIPEGATLQHGPGLIGTAVMAALDRPVRILSGLVTDALVDLEARGLLEGVAETGYLWGGPDLLALAGDGRVRLRAVEETHNVTRLGANPRFVAVNTAIEVGLDGSVNVERNDRRLVAGIGGHADFSEAGARSAEGRSIIALRATNRGRSSIVAYPRVVSTPRCDVDTVVTEYGVADLRGADDRLRATRLVAIAAPEHRDMLAAASPAS